MLVVDASVAVKFVAAEPGQDEAFARVRTEQSLIAPDWILIEVGHALWRKVRDGELGRTMAEQSLSTLPSLFEDLPGAAKSIKRAQTLAFELDHWLYDCIYLATALDSDAPLLTADRKFWNAAKRSGYAAQVELLTWPGKAE